MLIVVIKRYWGEDIIIHPYIVVWPGMRSDPVAIIDLFHNNFSLSG